MVKAFLSAVPTWPKTFLTTVQTFSRTSLIGPKFRTAKSLTEAQNSSHFDLAAVVAVEAVAVTEAVAVATAA